ncbi:MAG: ABC transporter ATP-binding protein [Alphaproteobacteria bacterium]|nr:ABC transporter ATP-binding protein [Alphaproteobacteria bacterium]
MLKIENVSKFFGTKQALCDVSFQVKKGQIAALLGENGAGKSTLLRVLSGYFEPDCGAVLLNDVNLKDSRTEFLQNIGYVQEISALYGEMTVYDFLCFASKIRRLKPETAVAKIKETVDLLQLGEVLLQKNETLSKGFKKRTELAAVLLAEPEVLLLDEPTEGLDPNQKATIRQIIKKYAKQHIVIISTHTLEDVEALANVVLLLHKGQLQYAGELKAFKKNAKNDLLASFRKATAD